MKITLSESGKLIIDGEGNTTIKDPNGYPWIKSEGIEIERVFNFTLDAMGTGIGIKIDDENIGNNPFIKYERDR